jgi:dual specificity protein kinase YAK1
LQLNRVYDPSGDSPLVRMLDFFVFRDHLCIVFELLSASIYDMLKENMFQGLSLNFSRLIISQILDALCLVRDAKLIHCDLKPENILLKS